MRFLPLIPLVLIPPVVLVSRDMAGLERKIEMVRQREEARSPRELVKRIAPAYGLDERLVGAVIEQESSWDAKAKRYEPKLLDKAARYSSNPVIRRELASSHGLMQVLGFWAAATGVAIGDLADPEQNIETGCYILSKNLEQYKRKWGKGEALWLALRDYNGRTKGHVYANAIMRRLGRAGARGTEQLIAKMDSLRIKGEI